jgi:hypothetical protein
VSYAYYQPRFNVPSWARSVRVFVKDDTGLPVVAGVGSWAVCAGHPRRLPLDHYRSQLPVEVIEGVWSGCIPPVSTPTTGQIKLVFSSRLASAVPENGPRYFDPVDTACGIAQTVYGQACYT